MANQIDAIPLEVEVMALEFGERLIENLVQSEFFQFHEAHSKKLVYSV